MNEKLLKFAAQIKDIAINNTDTDEEELGMARYSGYVLGNPEVIWAHHPKYSPLQAILRQIRMLLNAQVCPFELHKVCDALFANPGDSHNPKFAEVRETWTKIRKTLWLSEPFQIVKMLDVVAAESAFHFLTDLIMCDYFVVDVDQDVLDQFHAYPEHIRDETLAITSELGLQGDAVDDLLLKTMEAFNNLMFICEQEVAD